MQHHDTRQLRKTSPDPCVPHEKEGLSTHSTNAESNSLGGVPPTSSSSVTDALPLAEVLPGLPLLNYNVWHHKTKLCIFTALLVLESSLIPIALFYGLRYSTLRIGLIFAAITSFFGIVTGIEFGFRSLKLIGFEVDFKHFKLLKVGDRYRPFNGTRWSFDYTHHTLGFGYFYMSALLIIFSAPHTPSIRLLAIPVSIFLLQAGVQLVIHGVLCALKVRTAWRISSIPKGGKMRPLVFTLVEDIIGVDGNATREYRRALMARYEVSPRFRSMIVQQNWFWAVGALVTGIGTLVVIWTVPEVVAYGVGWGSPLVFVILWTAISYVWVRRSLAEEKRLWAKSSTSIPTA